MLIYVYDVPKREKRRFYYHLGKIESKKFITRSALLVRESEETVYDEFFKKFNGVKVFKIKAERIEQL